jgi:hypothetical protein
MASALARRLTLLGTVVGIAAGIVAVYQGLKPSPPSPSPSPTLTVVVPSPAPVPKSFLEGAAGSYSLSSWTEAGGPISLGVRMTEGTLQIDNSGVADWNVVVEQASSPDPGRVRMTARGRFRLDSNEIEGVPGGEFNNTAYLDNKWGQISVELGEAVRGWSPGKPENRFKVSLGSETDTAHILQMRNSFGTFTWSR